MSPPAALRPAATTLLVRDGAAGLEVWLMERSRKVGFMPAAWVFPGGRVDDGDHGAGDRDGVAAAFWNAALRELREEAGVDASGAPARVWAHWLTPEIEPRRYDTWFFLVTCPEGAEAVADGGEAVQGAWFRPADALVQHEAGQLPLAPPTLRTLAELAAYPTVAEAFAAVRRMPPIMPRFSRVEEEAWVLLPGDPEFPSDDPVDPPTRFPFDVGRWWAR